MSHFKKNTKRRVHGRILSWRHIGVYKGFELYVDPVKPVSNATIKRIAADFQKHKCTRQLKLDLYDAGALEGVRKHKRDRLISRVVREANMPRKRKAAHKPRHSGKREVRAPRSIRGV